jgi:hypothetical protein
VKCGNADCQNEHGPYLYAYWKEDKKLNKRYVGKNFEAFRLRQIAKEIKLRPNLLVKFKFIEQQASRGNVLAKQYLELSLTSDPPLVGCAHVHISDGYACSSSLLVSSLLVHLKFGLSYCYHQSIRLSCIRLFLTEKVSLH